MCFGSILPEITISTKAILLRRGESGRLDPRARELISLRDSDRGREIAGKEVPDFCLSDILELCWPKTIRLFGVISTIPGKEHNEYHLIFLSKLGQKRKHT